MNKSNVVIKINPAEMADLHPETVKASIARRAASASNQMVRRRLVALCLLAASVVVTLLVGAFAATKQPETVMETQYITVYKEGIGPWDITDEEKSLVNTAVMSVARGESELCQQAVAQALRNLCTEYDLTVAEAVEAYRIPATYKGKVSQSCIEAVDSVVEDGVLAINAPIGYFYNPECQSGEFHESLEYVCSVGHLRFFAI